MAYMKSEPVGVLKVLLYFRTSFRIAVVESALAEYVLGRSAVLPFLFGRLPNIRSMDRMDVSKQRAHRVPKISVSLRKAEMG
jgi:hypothetical protein